MPHRDVLLALALGVTAGLMFSALGSRSLGALLFVYIAMLPLFLVGLGGGTALQGVAVATSMLTAAAVLGVEIGGLVFALTIALPCHLLTALALRRVRPEIAADGWLPPGLLITVATGLGVLSVLVVSFWLASASGEAGIEATLTDGFERMFRAAFAARGGGLPEQEMQQLDATARSVAVLLAAMLPGFMASSWLLLTVVNAAIAQGILVGAGRALRPTPHLADVMLPNGLIAVLALMLAIAVAADGTLGYIARNVTVVLAAAFLLQGLGVVHALIRQWSAGPVPFILFYLVLFIFGLLAVFVVALGVAEPFLRIRDRLKSPRGR